jgi:hypothetical protein
MIPFLRRRHRPLVDPNALKVKFELADANDRVVKTIRGCDELYSRDQEFAYHQVRRLALELLDTLNRVVKIVNEP